MNKSYKVVFSKARGASIVTNEIAKSHQCKKTSSVVVAACIGSLLGFVSSESLASDTIKPATGFRINASSENNIYSAEVANALYASTFQNGISVTGSSFYFSGRIKNGNHNYAGLNLTVPSILVNSARTGIEANIAKSTLGCDSTSNIEFNTSMLGINALRESNLTLTANKINFIVGSDEKNKVATGIYVTASPYKTDAQTAVVLKGGEEVSLNASLTNLSSHAATVIGTYGSGTSNGLPGSTVKLSGDKVTLKASSAGTKNSSVAYGIHTRQTDDISISGKDISIAAEANKYAFGIRNDYQNDLSGANITIGTAETEKVTIQGTSINEKAYGILAAVIANGTSGAITVPGRPNKAEGAVSTASLMTPVALEAPAAASSSKRGHITVLGKEINVGATSKGMASAVELQDNNVATIGGSDSIVNVNATSSDDSAYGISALTGSSITVNGEELNVVASGKSSHGIWVQNNTTASTEDVASVTINSKKTMIKANTALTAMSQGNLVVNGDIETDSKTAILARGKAKVSVNETGAHTVKLIGDIDFNYDGASSGTTTDATVNLKLTNANSSWGGNAKTSVDPSTTGTPSEDLLKSNLNMTLSNEASWTPTAVDESVNSSKQTAVNTLALDGGVINLKNGGASNVEVNTLTGSGTINADVNKSDDGTFTAAGKITAKNATGAKFNVVAQNITADDVSDADAAFAAVNGVVGVDGAIVTSRIQEGAIKGALTQTVDADGNTTTAPQEENTKLDAYNTISSMATLAWRHDMNDLNKRMGELRDSPEGVGSWVRFYGSEQEYGRQNITSKSTSVQVGGDVDVGNSWKVGGAFTYTDGSSTYANGTSDNKAYGVAAYGTWLAENGLFVDMIGKYSRLSSDFDLADMSGKSKNNAYSASVEAGWHLPFAGLAFIEPQAELTYGLVAGDDFTTSNNVRFNQKDTKSLIGRIGLRTGFHFPEQKGTVYARASVLHDWKSESEFTASLVTDPSVSKTLKDDIGGTYYEFGVGANFNWTKNAYSYVDLEKQNGGDVKENWRWNVGFRYVW